VEDNEEFQQFMAKQLSDEYQVLKVQNGLQALELLNTRNVNIILCDIMMPVMDGLVFCKELKMNLRHSHIPVILLTAKTSMQSKIDGLNIGADEYIEKPYSIDYLRARIENLLENRKKIKDSYKNSPELNYRAIAHSKADEDFLNNLISIIHSHIDELELDVDKLATSMNMSRATLYRKVKNISELTPNDFIRLIRLKKAAELLVQKEYRVNEIAFIVGFRSSSYFSKCFQKQFGVLPKDFEKSRTSGFR
jgi:DNA-binding response OmpR family regulator